MNDVEEIMNEPIDISRFKGQIYEMMKINPEGWQELTSEKPTEANLDWFKAQGRRLDKEHERLLGQLEHYQDKRNIHYNEEIYRVGDYEDGWTNDANEAKNDVKYYSKAVRDTKALLLFNEMAKEAIEKLCAQYEQYLKTGHIDTAAVDNIGLLDISDRELLEIISQ